MLVWWFADELPLMQPVAIALSAAAMIYVAKDQSANALGAWHTRAVTLECALPLLAGFLIIGASRQAFELFG